MGESEYTTEGCPRSFRNSLGELGSENLSRLDEDDDIGLKQKLETCSPIIVKRDLNHKTDRLLPPKRQLMARIRGGYERFGQQEPIEMSPLAPGMTSSPHVGRGPILRRFLTITNWDEFFERMYAYYTGHGFVSIALARVFNLLTAAFVIGFSTFLIGCIDHQSLAQGKRHLGEVVVSQCLGQLHAFHWMAILVFSCFWMWELVQLIKDLAPLRHMHDFYEVLLELKDSDIPTTQWHSVVSRLIKLYDETHAQRQSSGMRRLNPHDIANRIMRKENYLIALFNKDLLDLSLPLPLPSWFFGRKQMLTKVLEWNLSFCVLNYVFDQTDKAGQMSVKKEFLRDVQRTRLIAGLKRRFLWMGLINLLLAPFTLVFLLMYFFFKYGEEFHKNPTEMSSRSYSPLARWKFRDFNELPHIFEARLNASYANAMLYMKQFPSHRLAVMGKFVSFVAGSIGLSLTLLSIVDDDFLLNFYITPGRSVLWYLGVFGIIWSAGRALVPDPHMVTDPETVLMDVVSDTHYLPHEWRGAGLHSDNVYREFSNLFEYRIVLFVQELVSIVFTPFILAISLPPCAPGIVDFFREFTVHVDSIGYVCSFAVFDFRTFNQTRGVIQPTSPVSPQHPRGPPSKSPAVTTGTVAMMTGDNKMEQSMLNFKRNFPEWEPPNQESGNRLRQLMVREEQSERERLFRRLKNANAAGASGEDAMASSFLSSYSPAAIPHGGQQNLHRSVRDVREMRLHVGGPSNGSGSSETELIFDSKSNGSLSPRGNEISHAGAVTSPPLSFKKEIELIPRRKPPRHGESSGMVQDEDGNSSMEDSQYEPPSLP